MPNNLRVLTEDGTAVNPINRDPFDPEVKEVCFNAWMMCFRNCSKVEDYLDAYHAELKPDQGWPDIRTIQHWARHDNWATLWVDRAQQALPFAHANILVDILIAARYAVPALVDVMEHPEQKGAQHKQAAADAVLRHAGMAEFNTMHHMSNETQLAPVVHSLNEDDVRNFEKETREQLEARREARMRKGRKRA